MRYLRPSLLLFAAFLIAALALFYGIDPVNAFTLVREIPSSTLIAVILLVSTGYMLRFLRWQLFLGRIDVSVPGFKSLTVFLAGLTMSITPARIGEPGKSLLLKRSVGAPPASTATVVIIERVTDLLGLLFLALLLFGQFGHGTIPFLLGSLPILMLAALMFISRTDRWLSLPFFAKRLEHATLSPQRRLLWPFLFVKESR